MFVAMPGVEPVPAPPPSRFHESNLWSTPIRDLGLTIAGTRLEPILAEFRDELRQAGVTRVRPRFYLSTEWGVPFETVAIAIPFYLARPDLTALHAERVGHVEGLDRADILRYLRHEMGHVVNYAYRLYDEEEWVKQFGSITQPYVEEYRPEPFSRRYVRHLPGLVRPEASRRGLGRDLRRLDDAGPRLAGGVRRLAGGRGQAGRTATAHAWPRPRPRPGGDRRRAGRGRGRDRVLAGTVLPGQRRRRWASVPPGLDGALRAIFEDLGGAEGMSLDEPLAPAAPLIRRLEPELMANVFRWTGHFPERTRVLLRYLAERAEQLRQGYAQTRESAAIVALTTLVTGLAMNHVQRGSYLP